jgi:hypothetical protein
MRTKSKLWRGMGLALCLTVICGWEFALAQPYGSIAIDNSQTAHGVFCLGKFYNAPTQIQADNGAVAECASDDPSLCTHCVVVWRFSGQGVCGCTSVAREKGAGTCYGNASSAAIALTACQSRGCACDPAYCVCNP